MQQFSSNTVGFGLSLSGDPQKLVDQMSKDKRHY